jgi:hypothetical protein
MTRRALKRTLKDNLSSYAFLAPWLLGFFVLTLYPMIYSLYLSFTKFNILQPPQWIGLKNFVVMFAGNDTLPRDQRFLNSLFVTLRFVFISVPLKLVFALAVAMLMNQRLRLIPFYRTLYYIPTLLGGSVAIAVLWRRLFAGDGVINAILRSVFHANPPAWISNPTYALYTLIILAVWQFGSPMIIFLVNSPDASKVLGNDRGASASATARAAGLANVNDQKVVTYLSVAGPHSSKETPHLPNDTELNSTLYLIYQQAAFIKISPVEGGKQIYDMIVRLINK